MRLPLHSVRRVLATSSALTLLAVATACGPREVTEVRDGEVAVVPVELVARGPIAVIHSAGGVVQSRTRSTLASKLVGDVVSVHVSEGDFVRRGQVLVEIDARDIEGQLAQARGGVEESDHAIEAAGFAVTAAEANADLATKTHDRFAALRQRGSVSAQEYDEVEARWKAAVAELDRAKLGREQVRARGAQARAALAQAVAARSWARIASPIDGVVTARLVDPGDQAVPSMPLVEVDDSRAFRVDVTVDESRVGRLETGRIVAVRVDSIGRDLQGRIAQIAPSIDPAVRAFLVKIDLPGEVSSELRSGMYARVMIPIGDAQAITVPSRAIVRRGQLTSVFIVDAELVARLRLVSTGRVIGGRVEILSGLDDGERIVAVAVESLRDGMTVALGERTESR